MARDEREGLTLEQAARRLMMPAEMVVDLAVLLNRLARGYDPDAEAERERRRYEANEGVANRIIQEAAAQHVREREAERRAAEQRAAERRAREAEQAARYEALTGQPFPRGQAMKVEGR